MNCVLLIMLCQGIVSFINVCECVFILQQQQPPLQEMLVVSLRCGFFFSRIQNKSDIRTGPILDGWIYCNDIGIVKKIYMPKKMNKRKCKEINVRGFNCFLLSTSSAVRLNRDHDHWINDSLRTSYIHTHTGSIWYNLLQVNLSKMILYIIWFRFFFVIWLPCSSSLRPLPLVGRNVVVFIEFFELFI